MALQLAGELGDRFPDGLYWVPLAALRDSGLVASAVGQTLSVDESRDGTLANAIARSLAEKRLLLLLDNCEHLLEAVSGLVASLLASCPNLFVLATSRQPIFVSGEHVFQLQPLASPDAVSLFEARARAAGATFDVGRDRRVVEQLCARLDNLPLAVELAAARTAAVPPAALLERLSSRLDLLKGPRDADERQRTLRATIAWSYDLLERDEQTAFRRMAVFSGGASLDAVETVCDADLDSVLSLVAQSLVRQTAADGAEPRYWMLATIHEFATAELESAGEDAAYRDRHVEWFAALARSARDRLRPGSNEWYARLERDLENLRAAFALALALDDSERDPAIALAVVLAPLHLLHGRYSECEDVIRKALALELEVWDEVRLRRFLGRALRQLGRWEAGIASHLDAQRLLASVQPRDDTWWDAWLSVRIEQAHHHYFQGNTEALAELVEELRPQIEEHASPMQHLEFLHVLSQQAFRRERYVLSPETEELQRETHRRSIAVGVDTAHFGLGFTLLWRGKFEEAIERLQDGLEAARRRGDALIEARCLVYQVIANRRLGDVERVRELLAEVDTLEHLHGYRGLVHANRAWLAYRDGDFDAAAEAGEAAIQDWSGEERAGPTVFQWTARFPLMGVALACDRPQAALEHARALLDPVQQPLPPELLPLVAEAVETSDIAALSVALEVAARIGYA